MSFVSVQFFVLIVLTILLYYVAPQKYRWYVLLGASCIFYLFSAGIRAFCIALLTIAVTFFAGIWIEKSAGDKKKRRVYLFSGVIVVLALLILVKLKNHLSDTLSWIIVPLGVSYYSFSLIGYLADIYYKKGPAEKNPLKMTLYALYFPKVIQGPISKFREIGPRLIEGHRFDYTQFCFGLQLILWGYFKKIVIADRASLLTGSVFSDFSSYDSGGAILLVVTFIAVIRMYCDWSGYMDIVIGVSQLMGIKLEENFKQPFFSKSAAEFWRRWHITLGVWFKDYVYMQLVTNPKVIQFSGWVRKKFGKRAGKSVMTIIPLAVVWILTGLWHGTGINYVIWGAYWGTIIILSNVFAQEIGKLTKWLKINTDAWDWRVFQTLRMFFIFALGLLISTYVGIGGLRRYFGTVLKRFQFGNLLRGEIYSLGLDKVNLTILLLSILLLFVVEVCQQRGSVRETIARQNPPTRWLIYSLAFVFVVFFGIYGAGYSTSGFAYAFF